MDYDVIIIGAGQAGCAAAFELSAKGHRVALLDRTAFPRRKACAGCLSMKAIKALPFPIDPVRQSIGTGMLIGRGCEKPTLFKARSPTSVMTVRSELDAFCLARCVEQGTSFFVVKSITAIREDEKQVEVHTNLGSIQARYCIGADGTSSLVRRLTGEFPDQRRGFAIEGTVSPDNPSGYTMEFDFFVVPFGYAWIFPKREHLNVGLYTSNADTPLKKERLMSYVRTKIGACALSNVNAHSLGFGGWKYRPGMKRVFLVGDAAGLADPLLGEGIHNAIRSGQAAARAILLSRAHEHRTGIAFERELRPIQADVQSCARSANWFYRYPRLGFFVMTLPTTRYLLMKGFSQGSTFQTIKQKPWRIVFSRWTN